ncbi:hypothetical protein [Stigmatella hybrida]|uniref:hypothetical protein n=1 Tax=Stigmatella hybrida TaxID=394097 RepID=UPI001CDAE0A4|nr:hypothetical protein [Stigmatella hybrida]
METSGSFPRLQLAVERLLESGTRQRVLRVPMRHMALAAVVLRRMSVSAWVLNMDGSQRFFVGI